MSVQVLSHNPSSRRVVDLLSKAYSLLTVFNIDIGNELTIPYALYGKSGAPLVWLIHNNDNSPHSVEIDPGTFQRYDPKTNKPSNTPDNPLTTATRLQAVVGGKSVAVLVATLKDPLAPGQFKYNISSDGQVLDPDLDVVDPGSVI